MPGKISKKRVSGGTLGVRGVHKNTPHPDNLTSKAIQTRQETPVCLVKFNHVKIDAIVDTGADISAISTSCLNRIPPACVYMYESGAHRHVQSVTGSRLEVAGTAHLHFRLGGRQYRQAFMAVSNLSRPLIFGSDFLAREGATIDFNKRNLHIGSETLKLVRKFIPVEECRVILRPGEAEELRRGARLRVSPGRNLEIGGATPEIGPSSQAERLALVNFLWERHTQFAASDLELGTTDLVDFDIDTQGNAPIRQRAYRAAWTQKSLIEEQVNSMLEAGVIEPSVSPWASPVLLVPKKDSTYRFCVDYRRVNRVTVQNAAPLPHMQDVLEALEGSQVFTTLDLRAGYWQMSVRPRDRPKTAFITHMGLYQFRKVPFGLCNAPAKFSQLMTQVLGDAQYKHCIAYLDDVVIYSKSFQDHMRHLDDVFRRLEMAGLKLKMSKCKFLQRKVEFLGHIVSKDGIEPCPSKTDVIRHLAPPTTVKEVRSFLGMVGYYRRFIRGFANLAKPLTNLTKKDQPYHWTKECQDAWTALKTHLVEAPILRFPSPRKPFVIYTDASTTAIGAILTQKDDEGREHVVQYLSHQLTDVQTRWGTTEREAYAIIYAMAKFRHYILGTKFIVYTDHMPLKSLFTAEMKNARVQRWAAMMDEYQCDIRHRPGRTMKADFLSRIPPNPTEPRADSGPIMDEDDYLPDTCLSPRIEGPASRHVEQLNMLVRLYPGDGNPPQWFDIDQELTFSDEEEPEELLTDEEEEEGPRQGPTSLTKKKPVAESSSDDEDQVQDSTRRRKKKKKKKKKPAKKTEPRTPQTSHPGKMALAHSCPDPDPMNRRVGNTFNTCAAQSGL